MIPHAEKVTRLAANLERADRDEWEIIIRSWFRFLIDDCADTARHAFDDDPYLLHKDIGFHQFSGPAQLAAHITAQAIADKIESIKGELYENRTAPVGD